MFTGLSLLCSIFRQKNSCAENGIVINSHSSAGINRLARRRKASMNEIDYYQAQKRKLKEFEQWVALIGKQYHGGGGGIGGIVTATCNLTIYFQEYNGAQNYHDQPADLNSEFAEACKSASPAIIASVREKLVQNVEDARKKAEAVAREILKQDNAG